MWSVDDEKDVSKRQIIMEKIEDMKQQTQTGPFTDFPSSKPQSSSRAEPVRENKAVKEPEFRRKPKEKKSVVENDLDDLDDLMGGDV